MPLGPALKVSPLCIAQVGHPDVVAEAVEAGVNFFMLTADLFWERDAATRAGLARLLRHAPRRDVVVLGMSYVADPPLAAAALDELARSVKGLDRLDVVAAGGIGGADLGPRLLGLKAFARSRSLLLGASFSEPSFTAVSMESRLVDLALVRYNALDDTVARQVLPFVTGRRGGLLFGFEALGGFETPEALDAMGVDPLNWRPSRNDHYRFVLSAPQLDGVVVSGLELGELDALVAALAAGPLDAPSQAYLVRTAHADPRLRPAS